MHDDPLFHIDINGEGERRHVGGHLRTGRAGIPARRPAGAASNRLCAPRSTRRLLRRRALSLSSRCDHAMLVASRCLAQAVQIEQPQGAARFVGLLSVFGGRNDLKLPAESTCSVVRRG